MERKNPFALLFSYPLTWLVMACIIVIHLVYHFWFLPRPLFEVLAFGVDIALLVLWGILFLNSASFALRFNEMPYEKQSRELKRIIGQCPEGFRKPAMESIQLIDSINKEFRDQDYREELLLLVANVYRLTNEHKRLYARYVQFGTSDQKLQIKKILDQQVDSMNKIYDTLQTFSGNLTILAANVEQTAIATSELKHINAGLQEVIQSGI